MRRGRKQAWVKRGPDKALRRCLARNALAALVLLASGTAAAQDDFMSLSLEELMRIDVGVASRVSRALDRQPASVTVIDAGQIRSSGARTLAELLMLHVPGFFLVEDQDDTITAVRGLAPDNNSKIMLMLDGLSLNADWFWGPPDALLNGLDLEFIERIELIRGPGSVTQGQGAQLGIVNLVTRAPGTAGGRLALVAGESGRRGAAWNWTGEVAEGWRAGVYLSQGGFDGQPYRNEGLARQVEQGLSVFERNHHLKRGDYRHLLARLGRGSWDLQAFRFEQRRDLYNWRRDREQVEQALSGARLGWRGPVGRGEMALDLHYQNDDYALLSHGGTRDGAARQIVPGLVLGGHREVRSGLRLLWSSSEVLDGHRLALGGEWARFASGRRNADGNNFIVNFQERVLEEGLDRLNREYRWVLPDTHAVGALFVEDMITLRPGLEVLGAVRWDRHPDWGWKLSPRLGLLWDPRSDMRWRLSWSGGFRGAVGVHYSGGFEGDGLLRESNFAAVEDNPFFAANGYRNLRPVEPERLSSLELAWNWQPTSRWRVGLTGFRNDVRDVIGVGSYFLEDPEQRQQAVASRTRIGSDRIGDWGGVFFFQNNPGSLTHRGLELELEYRREEAGLALRASHARVRVQHADAGQFGPGNLYVTGTLGQPRTRSFPEDVSRLRLEWRPPWLDDRLGVQLTVLHYPGWYPPQPRPLGGRQPAPRLPGNTLTDLGLSWSLPGRSGWTLWLEIKNLGNAASLYPATSVAGEEEGNTGVPGLERRSAWFTLRCAF
ncbi:MAG: hypothetical protein KatS3mg126_1381 [Lysobacteraceae bacterium]|nr:MAG: hypothetical protein KatS3mg126_1381 [Xanthomonadaceae bacterium]